jgi:hypothetical protein
LCDSLPRLRKPRIGGRGPDWRGCPPWTEAVGNFLGSDDFLCINDKEPILHQVILVSEAPLRPSEALL